MDNEAVVPAPVGRQRLALRGLSSQHAHYELLEDGRPVRSIHVTIEDGRAIFPRLDTDATESLGSDAADAEIRLRAEEEVVRLAAARRWSR